MNSRYTSYMKYRDFGNKVSSIPLETRSLCPNPCKGLISSVLEKRAGFEIVGSHSLNWPVTSSETLHIKLEFLVL